MTDIQTTTRAMKLRRKELFKEIAGYRNILRFLQGEWNLERIKGKDGGMLSVTLAVESEGRYQTVRFKDALYFDQMATAFKAALLEVVNDAIDTTRKDFDAIPDPEDTHDC